jgi:hypothetical protein
MVGLVVGLLVCHIDQVTDERTSSWPRPSSGSLSSAGPAAATNPVDPLGTGRSGDPLLVVRQ